MKLRALIILFIIPLGVCAQFPSKHGKFTVDYIEGCAPLVITVTHLTRCSGSSSCTYRANGINRTFVSGDTIGLPFKSAGTIDLEIITDGGGIDNDTISINVTANIPPTFDVFTCNGRQVKVNVTDTNYSHYYINYNDGTADVVGIADTHTYTTAPLPPPDVFRNVSVRGRNGMTGADNCISNTKPVKVTNALVRDTINQVLVPTIPGTEIQLGLTPDPTTQYRLMIATNNATSFQFFSNLYNTGTTETIPGLRPDDNFYCFRLDTFDQCTNTVAPGGSSSVICSTNLDAVAQDPLLNNITWVTAASSPTNNYTDFTLNRDGATLVPSIAATATAYVDAAVDCNIDYSYQLITNYADGSRSISMTKTITAITTQQPPAIADISSIVGDGQVALEWPLVAGSFAIEKSVHNGTYTPHAVTTSNTYIDNTYTTASNACYHITYTDACSNESDGSLDACPIRLSGNVQPDNTIALSWSDYEGWTLGVDHYVVEKYNADGVLIQTFDPVTATSMNDVTEDLSNQVYIYVVRAIPVAAAVTPSVSNEITIVKKPNLFYPTAFTPNNDGLNDSFKVYGQYVVKFEMMIFNRWGEMLYASDDLDQSWDGTYKGVLMPEATYVFKAKITDLVGRTFDRSGSVVLLRKK